MICPHCGHVNLPGSDQCATCQFDLTQLDYLGSSGVRAFVMAYRRLKGGSGRVRFCALQPGVKEVFDITGMSIWVEVFPTLQAALENFPPAA